MIPGPNLEIEKTKRDQRRMLRSSQTERDTVGDGGIPKNKYSHLKNKRVFLRKMIPDSTLRNNMEKHSKDSAKEFVINK